MKQPNYIGGRVPDPRVYQPLDSILDDEESGLLLESDLHEIGEAFAGLK